MLIHRAYRAVHCLRRLWWWLRRPTNHGTMVAVWCGTSILLVRTSYRTGWTLPGGFADRRETLPQAAARELKEEVGLVVEPHFLRETKVIFHTTEHLRDHVHIFELELDARPRIAVDGGEVVDARFAELSDAVHLELFHPARRYIACRAATRA